MKQHYVIKLKENDLYAVINTAMPFKIFSEETGDLLYRSGLVSTHNTKSEADSFCEIKNLRGL